ncbi:hypothetical protein P153DRAFT_356985 [Dothidotthia symphoricarpi CBS 119687]|uniref:Uncharacterized protein n=1 Tax=Dothidotthia symphoricarpi CBS 119687 TaxID=1392245 RepID=A0A6A6AEQ3_9PLEO|nr:uncharacterized protein P153DRAFT_356985 [Dothidotthia symphoricarpi CBS 119687]KAF2129407.1 hypothetical protein P153DRAFT_356985 [Dothidotthia symphoricarpi CBS 119687]
MLDTSWFVLAMMIGCVGNLGASVATADVTVIVHKVPCSFYLMNRFSVLSVDAVVGLNASQAVSAEKTSGARGNHFLSIIHAAMTTACGNFLVEALLHIAMIAKFVLHYYAAVPI